jgi:hypothetical protein
LQTIACGPFTEFYLTQTIARIDKRATECDKGQISLLEYERKPEPDRSLDLLPIFQNGVSEQSKIDHLRIQF